MRKVLLAVSVLALSAPHSITNMPLPHYDLLRPGRYINKTYIQTSRGCHHACAFCAEQMMYGLRFRFAQSMM
ncbi:MAG: hypothetical protein IPK78_10775 [Rhodospirillales bacterium]|nr:hypothetical protein [Rhodospirillales bacterium]